MPLPIRTAVAASTNAETLHLIALLLAESGLTLEAVARDGAEAIERLKAIRPDLLIVDEQLPSIDGIALAKRITGTFCLPVRPRIILLHYPEFATSGRLETESPGIYRVEKPVARENFRRAIAHITQGLPVFPEKESIRAEKLLDELGFSHHTGREVLKNAVLIAAQNEFLHNAIGKKLIPLAAEICSLTPEQAERAMRHAIAQAWRSDKFENQCRIFSNAVDAARGLPTLSEMISRLADILRLEG